MHTVAVGGENGVIRPLEKVGLPGLSRVEILIPTASHKPTPFAVNAVFAALQMRFRSGRGDLAERHNEHQA